jgi:predicted small secreted protein
MIKKLLVIFALSGGLVLSACNTVEGAAEDVDSVTDCADGQENNC